MVNNTSHEPGGSRQIGVTSQEARTRLESRARRLAPGWSHEPGGSRQIGGFYSSLRSSQILNDSGRFPLQIDGLGKLPSSFVLFHSFELGEMAYNTSHEPGGSRQVSGFYSSLRSLQLPKTQDLEKLVRWSWR